MNNVDNQHFLLTSDLLLMFRVLQMTKIIHVLELANEEIRTRFLQTEIGSVTCYDFVCYFCCSHSCMSLMKCYIIYSMYGICAALPF